MYQERSWEFFPVGDCFRKQYEGQLGWLEICAGWRFNDRACVTGLSLISRCVFKCALLCFLSYQLPLKDTSLVHFCRHIFCVCSTRKCFWRPADGCFWEAGSVEWATRSISDFAVNTLSLSFRGFWGVFLSLCSSLFSLSPTGSSSLCSPTSCCFGPQVKILTWS